MSVQWSARALLFASVWNVAVCLRLFEPQDNASESVPNQVIRSKYAEADRAENRYRTRTDSPWQPDQHSYVDLAAWSNSLNPNWQQNILDKDGVRNMFPELAAMFERKPRTVAARSDMVRLAALAAHGGVWADASVLPLTSLDSFVQHLARPSSFWGWAFEPYESGHASSWFLVARPNNPLVSRWKDAFLARWEHKPVFQYYEVHHTLMDLIEGDPMVSQVWDHMPKLRESWPHQCLHGCVDFWNNTNSSDRPPMLKRPYQHTTRYPPETWWAGYYAAMGS